MGEVLSELSPALQEFVARQPVFFVATAPTRPEGHINLSPKGQDSFRVLSPNEVGYLDLIASGNETSAHIMDNGRVTVMVCSFEGAPNIVRMYGRGSVHLPDSPRWAELRPQFPDIPGARQIITLRIDRIATSCGYAVPLMTFVKHRDSLSKWATVKGPEGLSEYQVQNNVTSIDGLPTHYGRSLRPGAHSRSGSK